MAALKEPVAQLGSQLGRFIRNKLQQLERELHDIEVELAQRLISWHTTLHLKAILTPHKIDH
jgi:hypothetical protein